MQKQASLSARTAILTKQLDELSRREASLKRAARFAEFNKNKTLRLLQDRDSDALRLRTDAAFSRRLHLAELEHAREQEAELHRLTVEHRKLTDMVAARRIDRPVLRRPGLREDDAATVTATPASMQDAKGKIHGVKIESTDETENFQRTSAVIGKGKIVDKYREMNVALLQQMVSTMEALRIAVDPVPTSH